MKTKKGRLRFFIMECYCAFLALFFDCVSVLGKGAKMKYVFERFVLGVLIVFAAVGIVFVLYEIACKTYYVLTDNSLQIIQRKKVLLDIPYAKIIRGNYWLNNDFLYIPLFLFNLQLFYKDENGEEKSVDLCCRFRFFKKAKNFPIKKIEIL
ncbi:MAG: hypothetical protein E7363_06210 [Clostridiales bacterium]|nr:hypothetical protein [Clostridiales bacterium]